jgi:hypothetical protein
VTRVVPPRFDTPTCVLQFGSVDFGFGRPFAHFVCNQLHHSETSKRDHNGNVMIISVLPCSRKGKADCLAETDAFSLAENNRNPQGFVRDDDVVDYVVDRGRQRHGMVGRSPSFSVGSSA